MIEFLLIQDKPNCPVTSVKLFNDAAFTKPWSNNALTTDSAGNFILDLSVPFPSTPVFMKI